MLGNNSVSVSGWRYGGQPAPLQTGNGSVVATGLLTGYGQLVRELQGDPNSLLREEGIDPAALDRIDEKVPLRAVANLLENSARVLECPDFGLRLAERQDGPAIMRPIDRLLFNAPTLRDVAHYVSWHMEPYSSGIRMTLEPDAEHDLEFFGIDLLLDESVGCPQLVEQIALLTCCAAISLTGGAARVRQVWFSHPRVGRLSAYAKRFPGTRVKFGQPLDGLLYGKADLACRVVHRDPTVFDYELQLVASRYPAHMPDIGVRVRQAILRALAEECCTREHVAALLGIHSRKLQRSLGTIGMSFEAVRDEVRRDLAARYLARRDLRLAEIVGRLGYSEPAVLTRSCRRWFSATPSQLRRNLTRRQ